MQEWNCWVRKTITRGRTANRLSPERKAEMENTRNTAR